MSSSSSNSLAFKLSTAATFYSNYLVQAQKATGEAVSNATQAAGQNIKWYIFREDCFEQMVHKFDFTNVECIKFAISKAIGYAIIAGSAILKVPQILKIMKNQSVEGISKYLFYFEVRFVFNHIQLFMYLHTTAYGIHKNISFSVYGENLIIGLQNLVIIFMIWMFNKSITMGEKIWSNFTNKSTGQLAFATFFLSFAGSAARLMTVLYETDDLLFQLQFIVSIALNGFVVLQFFLYWNSDKGKTQPSPKKGQKKGPAKIE